MTKKQDSQLVLRIKEMGEELCNLENAREAIYDLLGALEEAEAEFSNCRDINYGGVSHHAEMEIGDALCVVEERIGEIERRVANI